MVPWLNISSGFPKHDNTVQYYFTYGDLHPNVEIYILRRHNPDPRLSQFWETFYMYLDDTLGAKFELCNQGGERVDYLSPIIFKGYHRELKQFNGLVN